MDRRGSLRGFPITVSQRLPTIVSHNDGRTVIGVPYYDKLTLIGVFPTTGSQRFLVVVGHNSRLTIMGGSLLQ